MFQQIKQLLPDHWVGKKNMLAPSAPLERLRIGQTVQFGAMPQDSISEQHLIITERKLYTFSQAQFASFALSRKGKQVCWVIIAHDNESEEPYLAISRKLEATDLEVLLTPEDLKVLSHSSRLRRLFVREQINQPLSGWTTTRYERRIEGLRGKQMEKGTERVFEYELYVSEDNAKAIEIERFLDGHMDVYATIYRPMSDIVDIIHTAPRLTQKEQPQAEPSPEQKLQSLPKVTPLAPVKLEHKDIVETRQMLERKQQKEMGEQLLECDIKTAGTLIEEALRNDMRIADVVRKILRLPIATSDSVKFNFTLNQREYETLGKRYQINPRDTQQIRDRIIEELQAFAKQDRKGSA